MRAVELAKVAAAAEALHLRRLARRQAMRAAYGAGAAVFGIAMFVMLHVVGYTLLRLALSPVISSLIVLAVDLVVAGVLAMLALRDKPDSVETEAVALRKQALIEARQAMTFTAVASSAATLVLRRKATQATAPTRSSRAWLLGEIAARMMARR